MAQRILILCLEAKNHILTKLDYDMWKRQMRFHPKIHNLNFLHVYTVSKGDTLLKDASPHGKLNKK